MRTLIVCMVLATSTVVHAELKQFAEDGGTSTWAFNWNGYARLPLRLVDGPQGKRGPYLVDDDYFNSGFSYLRVSEREWVEFFLSAEQGPTRLVLGIQTSELSDWGFGDGLEPSPRTSPALAFVEHRIGPEDSLNARLRVGMMWERLGYIDAYDTYLIGRTHIAGGSVHLTVNKYFGISSGLGVYSRDKLRQTRSSLLGWMRASAKVGNLTLNLYALNTSTEDDDREFGATEYDKAHRGTLGVLGGEVLYSNRVINAQTIVAFYDAEDVEYIGNSVEILHSEGGLGLRRNFLNATEENKGTGQIQTTGFDVELKIGEALSVLKLNNPWLAGWSARFFGMSAWIATAEDETTDATVKENGRVYWKWGSELKCVFRPLGTSNPYLGFRYDRVVPHTDHESLSFRVLSPSIGVMPKEGLLVFAQWSLYTYGDNVFAREEVKQRVGDNTRPDEQSFKIQTQVRW